MLTFLPHSSRPFCSFLSFCAKTPSQSSASSLLRVSPASRYPPAPHPPAGRTALRTSSFLLCAASRNRVIRKTDLPPRRAPAFPCKSPIHQPSSRFPCVPSMPSRPLLYPESGKRPTNSSLFRTARSESSPYQTARRAAPQTSSLLTRHCAL